MNHNSTKELIKDNKNNNENITISKDQFELLMNKLNKLDDLDNKMNKLDDLDKKNIEIMDKLEKIDRLDDKINKHFNNLDNKINGYDDINEKDKEKINLILEILNKVLLNSEKNKIDKLTDFRDIDRDIIYNQINSNVVYEYEDRVCKIFNKKDIGWYNRLNNKCYTLSFIN